MADPRHQAISSRLVKEIAFLDGDVAPFTTPLVAKTLIKRCKELKT
jgi:pantetheine-phosphate adenylyltransferase